MRRARWLAVGLLGVCATAGLAWAEPPRAAVVWVSARTGLSRKLLGRARRELES